MAEHESSLGAAALQTLFNAVVRALAKLGLLPKEVHASLDSTCEEVCPSFEAQGV